MELLMNNHKQVLSREVLLNKIWGGFDSEVDTRAVDMTIQRLRKKSLDPTGGTAYNLCMGLVISLRRMMKNSIRSQILFINIAFAVLILTIIFFVTLNTFQKNIIDFTVDRMTEYSQEAQIYLMNYLKDYEYSDVYDEFKKLSPFASDYFSKKIRTISRGL